MSIIPKLATSLNRRDEVPNQELAKQMIKGNDKKSVKELFDNLSNKDKGIQSDCIKVIYEIGEGGESDKESKMKTSSSLLFIVVIILNGCSQPVKKEPFEGTINYTITFTPGSSVKHNYTAFQEQKYGDKMKLFIKQNGDLRREFPNSGSNGFLSVLFKADINKQFMRWRNIDTLYAANSAVNSLVFIGQKELPGEKIKGQNCKCYFISGIDPKNKQRVSLTYFYPVDKEYIDPGPYKNYKDFFFDKVIAKMQAPFYKLIMDMGKYSITLTMDDIDPHYLSPIIFKPPDDIPILDILKTGKH